MAAGRYAEAIPLYQALAKSLPTNPGIVADLGVALHMAGREQEAVSQLRKALRLDPQNVGAKLYLGYAYLSLGKPAAALPFLEAAARAGPANTDASENLGEALYAVGRFHAAAERFETLSQATPEDAEVWYRLGLCYQQLSQASFAELQKTAYGSAWWLALVAESNAKAGKYASAFYLYHQALAKMPAFPGAHAGLAKIYSATGHAAWAKTEQERERDSPDCARQSTECAFLAGRYGQIVAAPSRSPEVLYWKSKAYDQLALAAFLHLTSLPPSAQLHELLAETHEKARDYPAAVAEWRKAYDLSQQNPEIGQKLAIALIETDDDQGAERLLAKFLAHQPGSADLNYLKGYALLNLQQPAKAIPYFEESLRLEPLLVKAQGDLGRAYMQTGQSRKAIPHLEAALKTDQDGSLHYQLARAYVASGEPKLAAPMFAAYQKLHQASARESEALKQQIHLAPPPE